MPEDCTEYVALRESFVVLMLVHHILTMASIQYESVISCDLCDRMIALMDDIQNLPINDIRF